MYINLLYSNSHAKMLSWGGMSVAVIIKLFLTIQMREN